MCCVASSLRLGSLWLVLIPNPCAAQNTEDQPDLSKQAALLASASATERGTAIRILTAAGKAAIPYLREIIAAVEQWPPRPPVWSRTALYPSGSVFPPSTVFARIVSSRADWEFLSRYPDIPRSRRGRIRSGTRARNPRVLATAVLAGLTTAAAPRIRELLPLLADRDVEVRFVASFALGTLPDAVPALIAALDDDSKTAGAAHALTLLGSRARAAVFEIVKTMKGEVRALHRNALSLLAHLPQTELAAPLLVDRLGHEDVEVRCRASYVLEMLGRHALPALRRAIAVENTEQTCRALALFTRTSHWTPEDHKAIAKLAKSNDPLVRQCAAESKRIHAARTPATIFARLRPVLKELMREAINIERPNGSPMRRRKVTTVFTGSYDFHSCVIAHWSLLVMARLDRDDALEKMLLAKLDPATLEREAENLVALPDNWLIFPYDHGWFLMLLSELAKREGPNRAVIARVREKIENRILSFLEKTPLPDAAPRRQSRQRTFIGYYRSWLMSYLLVQLSKPSGKKSVERLKNLRATKIEPNRAAITGHATAFRFDFLWLPAILALIDRTTLDPDAGEPTPYQAGTLAPLPYRVPFNRVHQLGQELTRIWPLAYDAGHGDEAARRAYAARVHEYIEHPEILAGSYNGIAHWIPQFLWIGMWLSLGPP